MISIIIGWMFRVTFILSGTYQLSCLDDHIVSPTCKVYIA